jgi:hypothetical protein
MTRSKKRFAQIPLNQEDLHSFTWPIEEQHEKAGCTADGIDWSVGAIYDIFSMFADLTSTVYVGKDELLDFEWFEHDVPLVRKEAQRLQKTPAKPIINCWYTRWSRVSTRVLLEIIYARLGVTNQAGRKPIYDKINSPRAALMLVPTDSSQGKFPPFEIDKCSVAQWISHFASLRSEDSDRDFLPIDQTPEAQIRRDISAFETNTMEDSIDFDAADEFATGLEEATQMQSSILCNKEGIDVSELTPSDFQKATFYPCSDLSGDRLSRFASIFMGASIYGQAALLSQFIQEETKRCRLLRNEMQVRLDTMAYVERQLDEQLSVLKGIQKESYGGVETMDATAARIENAKKAIRDMCTQSSSLKRFYEMKYGTRPGEVNIHGLATGYFPLPQQSFRC